MDSGTQLYYENFLLLVQINTSIIKCAYQITCVKVSRYDMGTCCEIEGPWNIVISSIKLQYYVLS